MTPKIAIVAQVDTTRSGHRAVSIPTAYISAVENAGGIPFILPLTSSLNLIEELTRETRGFVFPGGFDLDPDYFNESPIPEIGIVDRELDRYQLAVFNLCLQRDVPVLGICRGAQVINVAMGGSLFQDLKAQHPGPLLSHMQARLHTGTDHPIEICPKSRLHDIFGPRIMVNSRHHQAVKLPGKGLNITAASPDGVIEALEHEALPIDLVQWHPELMLQQDQAMAPLFTYFIKKCRAAAENS